jgi:hypothetical protein
MDIQSSLTTEILMNRTLRQHYRPQSQPLPLWVQRLWAWF